jgi:hypothetical protein
MQAYVLRRLDGHKGPDWLDGQTLEQAVKATQMLGLVMTFGTTNNLGSVDRDDWNLAGRIGWEWVTQGERGLHAAFRELQASAFARGQGGQNYFTVFGQVYRWLLERGDRSDHGPIKQVLRDYILKNMDVCVGRKLLGKPVERRKKYSVQSLAIETRLHRQTLCKVLIERDLIAAADADKPYSILLVDAEKACEAAGALNRAVPFVKLPTLLNATRPIVSCLVGLELLTPLHRSVGENTRDKCGFDAREIEQLMERIHALAPEMTGLPADWVNLTQCTKRARVPMRQLLQMILQSGIRKIGRAMGESGFNALRFDIEEIRLRAS